MKTRSKKKQFSLPPPPSLPNSTCAGSSSPTEVSSEQVLLSAPTKVTAPNLHFALLFTTPEVCHFKWPIQSKYHRLWTLAPHTFQWSVVVHNPDLLTPSDTHRSGYSQWIISTEKQVAILYNTIWKGFIRSETKQGGEKSFLFHGVVTENLRPRRKESNKQGTPTAATLPAAQLLNFLTLVKWVHNQSARLNLPVTARHNVVFYCWSNIII